MTALTSSELTKFESQLRAEREAVLAAIREHLHASGEPGRMALLNHLETVGDWVEADLLNDTDIALLSHELVRLRNIDGALARIKSSEYGQCVDCGKPIPAGRLQVLPTAQTCVHCQEAYEKQHGLGHNASY